MRYDPISFPEVPARLKAWTAPQMRFGRLTDAEIAEARKGPEGVAAVVARLRAEGRV
jgi:hypothetical protein